MRPQPFLVILALATVVTLTIDTAQAVAASKQSKSPVITNKNNNNIQEEAKTEEEASNATRPIPSIRDDIDALLDDESIEHDAEATKMRLKFNRVLQSPCFFQTWSYYQDGHEETINIPSRLITDQSTSKRGEDPCLFSSDIEFLSKNCLREIECPHHVHQHHTINQPNFPPVFVTNSLAFQNYVSARVYRGDSKYKWIVWSTEETKKSKYERSEEERHNVVYSYESSIYYPYWADSNWRNQFNITIGMMRNYSTIHSNLLPKNFIPALLTPYNPIEKTAEAAVLYVASNCKSKTNRDEYVEELMTVIPVHSYGKCLHNKDFPEELLNNFLEEDRQSWFEPKDKLMRKYKFYLSFENSIEDDYVTEKFFGPLTVNTVPVYMGAKNVHDYFPFNHSFIRTADFPSAKALGNYLLDLDHDENKYAKYFDWKQHLSAKDLRHLQKLQRNMRRYWPCHLCQEIINKDHSRGNL